MKDLGSSEKEENEKDASAASFNVVQGSNEKEGKIAAQFWTMDKVLSKEQEEEMIGLASKVIEGSRSDLSRAITLVESSNLDHQYLAQCLLSHLYQCYVLIYTYQEK